jgi:hypothetical protein
MKLSTRCVSFTWVALVWYWSRVSVAQSLAEREEIVRFGEDITVTAADVLDEAVAIGGSVTVLGGGQVTQSVMAIGGDVILNAGAQIDGDVVVVGGEIRKDKEVRIGGKEVVIAGGVRNVLNTICSFHYWRETASPNKNSCDLLYTTPLLSCVE